MAGGRLIRALAFAALLAASGPLAADSLTVDLPDSTAVDTAAVDSLQLPIEAEPDTSSAAVDSIAALADSLMAAEEAEAEVILPPPMVLDDSLAAYFSRYRFRFDISINDLYPRDAAGFLAGEASYFGMTYLETPMRTAVLPFGLPGGGLTVQDGDNQVRSFDRTVPPDGNVDFSAFATGDITAVDLIEGPLSAYGSPDGGAAMMYVESNPIVEGPARSEFHVERGSYGYAYTRARLERRFTRRFGAAISTDYRKGDGYITGADDDSYYIKTHVTTRPLAKTIADFYLNLFRREGGFPVMPDSGGFSFRRLDRDQQYIVAVTRQDIFGGEIGWKYQVQVSRSAYSYQNFYRTIKPRDTYTDLAYTTARGGAVYRVSVRLGKEQYKIDQLFKSRYYGFGGISGLVGLDDGALFFFGRLRRAENEEVAFEGAAGLSKQLGEKWQVLVSAGYLNQWPELTDLYTLERTGVIGTGPLSGNYAERGNTDLESEKRLTANATIKYASGRATMSGAVNGGRLENVIYYDRVYDTYTAGEVYPANDNIDFVDVNLSGRIDPVGPFYVTGSATGRKVESDRYGDRPPYSPRWQVYGRAGVRYTVRRYEIDLRLFGEISHTEKPLSYKLEELDTGPLFSWGVNAALKSFSFYYRIHNATGRVFSLPEGYGPDGWYNSWGFNWKFLD